MSGSRAQEESEEPFFRESGATLTLGNRFYEVDFDSRNGAITRIFDKRGGGVVSEGNADGSLWAIARHYDGWARNPDQEGYDLAAFSHEVPSHRFHFRWLPSESTLELRYELDNGTYRTDVTVKARVTDSTWFDLTASVSHLSGPDIDWFSFPHSLAIDYSRAQQALVPTMPGALLNRKFFEEGRRFTAQYPSGSAFVDLTWFGFGDPTMAWYAIHGPSIHWPARIELNHFGDQGQLNHVIAAGLAAGQRMSTPTQRGAVGTQPLELMALVRDHNRYGDYPSLARKLGDISQTALASARLSVSPRHFGRMDFLQFGARLRGIEPPLIIWLVDYMEQGWIRDQPDVWPPAEELGGVEGYMKAMSSVQRGGNAGADLCRPTLVGTNFIHRSRVPQHWRHLRRHCRSRLRGHSLS